MWPQEALWSIDLPRQGSRDAYYGCLRADVHGSSSPVSEILYAGRVRRMQQRIEDQLGFLAGESNPYDDMQGTPLASLRSDYGLSRMMVVRCERDNRSATRYSGLISYQ